MSDERYPDAVVGPSGDSAFDLPPTDDADETGFVRALLANTSDGMLAMDSTHRIVFANPAAGRTFGYAPDELVGTPVTRLLPDRLQGFYEDIVERYIGAGERRLDWSDVELPGRHRDGHELSLSLALCEIDRGGETLLAATVRDVTERRQREQEFERFAAIGETVVDGIYALDPGGNFVMVNEAYADMTGYGREELIGTHSSEITGEETNREVDELQEALAEGERELLTVETDLPTADGGTTPVEARIGLLPFEDGEMGRVGVVRDVTERKQYEQTLTALHESSRDLLHVESKAEVAESVLRTAVNVLDLPGVSIYLFDEEADLLYPAANSSYVKEVFGEMPTFGPDDEAITRWTFNRGESFTLRDIGNTNHAYREDTPLKSGIWIPLGDHGVIAIVSEETGAFSEEIRRLADLLAATAESALDRVEREEKRKQYEQKLEETVSKLEASNTKLERFAYIASHDLQEPLRMISSYLQLLERRYADELDSDAREFIGYAVDGAERMRDMINDLLTYSRIDTHGDPFELVDVGGVVDQTIENLQIAIRESGATVEVGDLPTLPGDENQLIQLFQNLVENAIKYGGDDSPTVRIDAEELEDAWRFSVRDDGIGIDPDDVDRIFQVFSRLHRIDEYSGTGIGLSLCQKIVERHGGGIEVESEPGEGTTFVFTLSVDPDSQEISPRA